jgi:hypothetical protein
MVNARKHDDGLRRRVSHFRRIYRRGVGKSPPAEILHALARLSELAAADERLRSDPSATITDRVLIGRELRMAQRELGALRQKAAARREPVRSSLPSLAALLAGRTA